MTVVLRIVSGRAKERKHGLIHRLFNSDPTRVFVLKDVGGETARVEDWSRILGHPDTAHLKYSDWFLLALDGRSEACLVNSFQMAAAMLDCVRQSPTFEDTQKPGMIVALTRIDETLDKQFDRIRASVVDPRYQNKFRGELVDLDRYLQGMQQVQEVVRREVHRILPALASYLDIFDSKRMHYCALSSLGHTPIPLAGGGNDFEAQCLCEPGYIRVMDSLLWMLHDEHVL